MAAGAGDATATDADRATRSAVVRAAIRAGSASVTIAIAIADACASTDDATSNTGAGTATVGRATDNGHSATAGGRRATASGTHAGLRLREQVSTVSATGDDSEQRTGTCDAHRHPALHC